MAKAKKLTADEQTQLTELTTRGRQLEGTAARLFVVSRQLEVAKSQYEQDAQKWLAENGEFEEQMNSFRQELFNSYGDINVDVNTGVITPVEKTEE